MALWRVRATVVDKPGFLAVLAASLALRSVNILSVGVHVTEAGAVDDFLVDAPDELTEQQLLAAVERGRGRQAWVARADAHSLVDGPTRALDLATLLVRDPGAVAEALAELLDAEATWQPDPADGPVPGAGSRSGDRLAGGGFGVAGPRMRVPAPDGGAWLVERATPAFTPAEYARAQAVLAVAAAVAAASDHPVPGPVPDRVDGPADRVGARPPGRHRTGPGPDRLGGLGPAALLLPDGRELALRRAGPADLAAVRALHHRCSPESLRQRYLAGGDPPADARLARLLAPATGCALVAEAPGAFAERLVALANLVGEGLQAELAVLVEDAWQRRGIGTALLRRAVRLAADLGYRAVVVHTHAHNQAMLRTLRRLPGARRTDIDSGVLTVTLPLPTPVSEAAARSPADALSRP